MKTISSQQVISDLISIHSERINTYKQMLGEATDMELDMKSIIERIVEESIAGIRQLQNVVAPGNNGRGDVYLSWEKMKRPMVQRDRKATLETCANDELIMINTYSIALSMLSDPTIVKLLEEQQDGLKKLHSHIRRYRYAQ